MSVLRLAYRVVSTWIVFGALALLGACGSSLDPEAALRLNDVTNPVVQILAPLDGGIYLSNLDIEGKTADVADAAGSAGSIASLSYDVGSGLRTGDIILNDDGTFAFTVNTGGMVGAITITVTAVDWNGNEASAKCTLYPPKQITSFMFKAAEISHSQDAVGAIDESTITVEVPGGTDRSALRATFEYLGVGVFVDGAPQSSGSTVNDFSSSVQYTVQANDSTSKMYTVTVKSVPSPPGNLVATAESDTSISLTWDDNSDYETGQRLERKTGAGDFTLVDDLATDQTSYTDTGLTAGTTYSYRIRAYNLEGPSSWSNEAVATTMSIPDAPGAVVASPTSVSATTVSWADNSDNESGFEVERKTGSGGSYVNIGSPAADITSIDDTGLLAGQTYYYQVRAINGIGSSGWAAEASVTMPQSGEIDTGFGSNGYVVTEMVSGGWDSINDIAVDGNGRIIACGSVGWDALAVARYNTDGSLDITFSDDGKLILTVGTDTVCDGVAVQADGKIVLSGSRTGTTGTADLALVRLNTDGSLDTGFHGDGWLSLDIDSSLDSGWSVTTLPGGQVLVAGDSSAGYSYDVLIAQFTSAGDPDTGFGTDGWSLTDGDLSIDSVRDMIVMDDGRVVVVARLDQSPHTNVLVTRCSSAGAPDTTLDGEGKVVIDAVTDVDDEPWAGTVDSDGKIILVGQSGEYTGDLDVLIVRLNSDGSYDTTFSSDGIEVIDLGTTRDWATGVISNPDGTILVSGTTGDGAAAEGFLLRLTSTGSMDTSFHTDGIVTFTVDGDGDEMVCMKPYEDGRVVIAGESTDTGSGTDFALIRFWR